MSPPLKSRLFRAEAEAEYVEWAGGRVFALGRVMVLYGVVAREEAPGWECMCEVEGTLTVRSRPKTELGEGEDLDVV